MKTQTCPSMLFDQSGLKTLELGSTSSSKLHGVPQLTKIDDLDFMSRKKKKKTLKISKNVLQFFTVATLSFTCCGATVFLFAVHNIQKDFLFPFLSCRNPSP